MSQISFPYSTPIRPASAADETYHLALAHREETENLRKIAPAVIEQLSARRLFRMGLPKSLGGWEDNPTETLTVYETLASAEASVSWIVWNNHLACTFGRFLDSSARQEVFNNPEHIYANSARPEGVAVQYAEGYTVSGRWTLVSGCELADWFVLRCRVTSDGAQAPLSSGANLKLFFIGMPSI